MLTTRKAQELDVVELIEDLPEYGLKRGERGAVVVAFDQPEEAYDLEFVDETGKSRLAYSVKPSQIRSADETAKEAFERGLALLSEGKPFEAEKEFQRAIDLIPALIVNLHNFILNIFENRNEWESFILALRLVLRLNPGYEAEGFNLALFARDNLAMAYQNFAAQIANKGEIEAALVYLGHAMGIGSRLETIALIRKNIAKAYTSLGIQASQSEDYVRSLAFMNRACEVDPNDMTRHNLGIAYAYAAEHYLDQQEYENAITVFEHAMDIGLIFPELLNDYGLALATAGHQDEAILAFQRALKLSPDNEIIQHNLNLVEGGANDGFSIVEIKAEFYSAPPMQQHEYSIAV